MRKRRRWGSLLLGVFVLLFGIVVTIVGGVILLGEETLRTADAEARGSVPGAASFDSKDGRYAVVLGGQVTDLAVNATRCEVTYADGSKTDFQGNKQTIDVGDSVGEFKGKPGRTTVDCRFVSNVRQGRSTPFTVSKVRTGVRTAALVIVGVGVVMLLGSVALLVRGFG